jgi:hypothetical protein
MISSINNNRDAGMSIEEACLDAGHTRLSPLWIRAITGLADLGPAAYGSGGLSFSYSRWLVPWPGSSPSPCSSRCARFRWPRRASRMLILVSRGCSAARRKKPSKRCRVREQRAKGLLREGRACYRCLDKNSFTTRSKPRGLSRNT